MTADVENVTEERVDARTLIEAVGRAGNMEHFALISADLEGDEVVVEYEEPVGECPACGSLTVGTTAWNVAHDRTYICRDDGCAVERHHNEVRTEGGDNE